MTRLTVIWTSDKSALLIVSPSTIYSVLRIAYCVWDIPCYMLRITYDVNINIKT